MQLRVGSCCLCCSLKIGAILVGVFSLVGYIVLIIGVAIKIGVANCRVAKETDEEEQETHKDINFVQPTKQEDVDEVMYWILLVIFVLYAILNIMLIVGAVQEKAELLYMWFVASVIGLVFSIVGNIATADGLSIWGILFNTGLTLYFILVVHSYYKEIQEKQSLIPGAVAGMYAVPLQTMSTQKEILSPGAVVYNAPMQAISAQPHPV